MMTKEQRIEWLLKMQDHPEQITDAQMQQILADDEMRQLVQQLGFAKRAFKHDELKNEREQSDACINSAERGGRRRSQLKNNTPDVDNEWEKFAAFHAEELDALDEEESKKHFSLFTHHFSLHKVAASFFGVLLASGIAFAAIWSLTHNPSPKDERSDYTQVSDTVEKVTAPLSTEKEVGDEDSYVFDNVPLDSMLTTIAVAHGIQVEFENETARELRFHFVWKREDSLTRVVEKLNTFEAVNIGVEDKKMVVR